MLSVYDHDISFFADCTSCEFRTIEIIGLQNFIEIRITFSVGVGIGNENNDEEHLLFIGVHKLARLFPVVLFIIVKQEEAIILLYLYL